MWPFRTRQADAPASAPAKQNQTDLVVERLHAILQATIQDQIILLQPHTQTQTLYGEHYLRASVVNLATGEVMVEAMYAKPTRKYYKVTFTEVPDAGQPNPDR